LAGAFLVYGTFVVETVVREEVLVFFEEGESWRRDGDGVEDESIYPFVPTRASAHFLVTKCFHPEEFC
jgi:hypothetical protein